MEAPPYLYGIPSSDFLHIDDLLDFSNDDIFAPLDADSPPTSMTLPEPDGDQQSPEADTHQSFPDCQDVTDELCVPSDDVAELEWLSNFVEDSFSTTGYSCAPAGSSGGGGTCFWPDAAVPGRARSKRSRAAVCDWTSRIVTSSAAGFPPGQETGAKGKVGRKAGSAGSASEGVAGRKCTHCAAEKTPQWRAGPMGPKTLCNACGVRYKSGRLVPEYRPAASPTFMISQHSNSHRKVMELRRQKEMVRHPNRDFFGHERQQQDFRVI
ncbi:GATA transcription factor 2 [Nymphaea thermarum]|nr:GATA transcription factor 2 [Nymphaea thermarum]